jgi:3-oxoacyl-[acyl-carrier-protein] synthase II
MHRNTPGTDRRVVLTGSGVVTPFGDRSQSIEAVRAGRSALAPVSAFDASAFGESRAGECTTFDARPWFRIPKALKLADRRTRFAVAAASMALADAGLDYEAAANAGVVIGTNAHDVQVADMARALGPLSEGDVCDIDYFGGRILRKLPPLWLLVSLSNMASAHVAIQLGALGPNSTITTDWISGLQAIGEAARWIAGGDADVVLAGGADCGVLPLLYAAFDNEAYFGAGEPAFVPAEGAAIFVVEELEHARARQARILGEVTGYASSSGDDALSRTMSRAIEESGSPNVDLICDAALFAPLRREDEERAIRGMFPTAPARFECNSLTGFAMSAAAPIALALASATTENRSIVVNSLGAQSQAASLAVSIGDAA